MNRIKQKLRSKDGLTIAIALTGFMVAAMVSIVIIAAAVTAAERVTNDVKETQAHLTIESAAQVVVAELEKTDYKFKKPSATKTDITVTDTSALKSEITAAVAYVDEKTDNYVSGTQGADFTIALNAGSSPTAEMKKVAVINSSDPDAEKKSVAVSFVMKNGDDKYDIVFTLDTKDPKDEIYINADGYCTTEPDEEGYYHITWKVVSINRLDQPKQSAANSVGGTT